MPPPPTPPSQICQKGYREYFGSCYKLYTSKVSYYDASRYCNLFRTAQDFTFSRIIIDLLVISVWVYLSFCCEITTSYSPSLILATAFFALSKADIKYLS